MSMCMLHPKFILSSFCGSVWECLYYMPSSFCHPTVGVCVGVYVTCQVHFVILLWEWVYMLHAKFILPSFCGSGCVCYMPSSFCHPTVGVCVGVYVTCPTVGVCVGVYVTCQVPSSFCHPTVEVLCGYVCVYATCQVHFGKRPAFPMGTIPILTVQFTE